MTAALDVHGQLTMTCEHRTVIVRGLGNEVEIEVPGLFWALSQYRHFRQLVTATARRRLGVVHTTFDCAVTIRTCRRRWVTIQPNRSTGLLAWLGLPAFQVHLLG